MDWLKDLYYFFKSRGRVEATVASISFAFILLGSISSFIVYRHNFADTVPALQNGLAGLAAFVGVWGFLWVLHYGIVQASSLWQRLMACLMLEWVGFTVGASLATHLLLWQGYPLTRFYGFWDSEGALVLLGSVLLIVLVLTIADPLVRLIRLELRESRAEHAAMAIDLDTTWLPLTKAMARDLAGVKEPEPSQHWDIFPLKSLMPEPERKLLLPATPVLTEPLTPYQYGYEWRRNDERGGWHLWHLNGELHLEHSIAIDVWGQPRKSKFSTTHYVGFLTDEAWNAELKYRSAEEFIKILRFQLLSRPVSRHGTPKPTQTGHAKPDIIA